MRKFYTQDAGYALGYSRLTADLIADASANWTTLVT
jgi:hypothetical protein